MHRFNRDGCKFDISGPVEAFRVENYGDEEEFTSMILDEVKTNDLFFDIGACVGLVSVHASKNGAKVYSFEPDPYYRSRLITNLRLNGLTNVRIIEWAVSDNAGTVTLFTDGKDGFSPSLRNIGDRRSINVSTDSIDNAICRGEIPSPDVIKMDIEGCEILALRGMKDLLVSEAGPRAIFMEVHPDFLVHFGSSAEEVMDLMSKYGYALNHRAERSSQFHCIFRKQSIVKETLKGTECRF